MATDLTSLQIKVDTKEVQTAEQNLNKLSNASNKMETSNNKLGNSFGNMTGKIAGVAGALGTVLVVYEKLIKNGVTYTSLLENQLAGLTALRVATTKNEDAQGNALSLQEKYTIAQKESIVTLQKLQEVNKRTPQQLAETLQIYKTLSPTLGAYAKNQDEILKVTELLAKASAAYGIEFQQLLAGVDGLATGTVLANSELGRFLQTIGLSNQALKGSSDVVGLVIEKLTPLGGELDTLTVANSNLTNAWNELSKVAVAPFFDSVKQGVKETTSFLEKATIALNEFYNTFKDASNLQSIDELNKRVLDIYSQIQDKQKQLDETSLYEAIFGKGGDGKINAELRALNIELLAASKEYEKFTKQSGLVQEGNAIKELSDDLMKMIDPLGTINKKYDLYLEQLKQTADYNETNVNKINELRQKEIDSLNQKIIKEQEVKEVQLNILEEYYLAQQDYQTAWLVKSSELNAQLVGLEEQQAQTLLEKWKTEYFDKINELRSNEEIQQIETNFDGLNEALDAQIALIESSEQWGNSLGGVAGDILNIAGAYKNVEKVSLKYQKEQLKADEKLAKTRAKYGDDSIEAIEAEIDHHLKSTEIKEKEQQSEINGFANIAGAYGSMAGSIASMAEEGSTAAKVATVAQQALAIASGVAAIMQQGMGDPYTAFARIAAMTALVVSTLASFGVSGGGGAGAASSPYSEAEIAMAKTTELNDETVVNRLDQQIELLEAIERNGSAQALSLNLAEAEFTQSLNQWVQEVFDVSRLGWVDTTAFGEAGQARADAITRWEESLGGNVFDFKDSGSQIKIDTASLRSDPMLLINALSSIMEGELGYSTPLGQGIFDEVGFGAEAHEAFMAQLDSVFSEMQGHINDWAISVVDTVAEMASSADTMKELYDDLTGTDFYSSQKLTQAFKDFDNLLSSGESYSDYLVKNIDSIEESSKFIYEMSGVLDENAKELTNYELLLSKNGDLIEEQIALVDRFGATAGTVFEGGVEEALNYLESIELVTEAMATSRENINSFYEGFRSQEQSLGVLASGLGVTIPQTAEQYFKLFESMRDDLEGLTDDELAFLEASKEYIQSQNDGLLEQQNELNEAQQDSIQAQIDGYNELTTEVETNISTLNTIITSITSTVDKLRGSSTGGAYTLEQFYKALELAENLSGGKDYEALSEAIKDVSSYSSALSDSDLFSSDREMAYAQSVAANRLEGIESTSLTQIDYLQQIADNTKATVDALLAQLQKLGQDITDSNNNLGDDLQDWFDKNYPTGGTTTTPTEPTTPETPTVSANDKKINEVYNTVFGRDAGSEGLEYWGSRLDTDLANATTSELEATIAKGASNYADIESALQYFKSNKIIAGQSLLDKVLSYDYITDSQANTLLAKYGMPGVSLPEGFEGLEYELFKSLWRDSIVPFAKGGIVTAPTVGLIGEAGYSEAVIPLNGQDHLGIGALTRKIDNQNAIINQQNNLIREQNLYLKDIRDIDNSSYLKLQTIGDRI